MRYNNTFSETVQVKCNGQLCSAHHLFWNCAKKEFQFLVSFTTDDKCEILNVLIHSNIYEYIYIYIYTYIHIYIYI